MKTENVAQMIDDLSSMHRDLGLIPSISITKEKEEEEKQWGKNGRRGRGKKENNKFLLRLEIILAVKFSFLLGPLTTFL